MPELVLGPMLRYVSDTEAVVWVETDEACEVEVLEHRARTFGVEGHHYALVCVRGLEPARTYEYGVSLEGESRWPEPGSELPKSVIRTVDPEGRVDLIFGSCRVALPHHPPYTLTKDKDERGRGLDALHTLALSMLESEPDGGRSSSSCSATRSTLTRSRRRPRSSFARSGTRPSRRARR